MFSDDDAVQDERTFSVRFEFDGRKFDYDGYYIDTTHEEWTENYADGHSEDVAYEQNILVIPKPDWLPEHGTAKVTVTQYFEYYDIQYTTIKDVEF